MEPSEIDIRIDYFHNAPDNYLRTLGVDRASLPSPKEWRSSYATDCALPVQDRKGLVLLWQLDGREVGFSSADRIVFGVEAYMHLHVLEADNRHKGLGVEFVRKSAAHYFRILGLERLFCEPNAFNVAPNRTLQKAGFRYLFTHEAQPGPINFFQTTTRWVLDRPNQRG
jgi:RimJ/RimL family protein N-acetyltransferase